VRLRPLTGIEEQMTPRSRSVDGGFAHG